MSYKVGSLFAGIGGICLGLKQAGCEIKWANELDEKACETYIHNIDLINSDVKLYKGSIVDFSPEDKDVDIVAGGFPCQPYSLAGPMRGLEDERAEPMFREMVRVAVECNARAIFMENVAILRTLHKGTIFQKYVEILNENGYQFLYHEVFNTKDFGGIAQNRNRLYMVAFKSENDYDIFNQNMKEKMTETKCEINYWKIIKPNNRAEEKYYYSEKKMLRFNEDVVPVVTNIGTIYQYRRNYTRVNKNGLCPALTASMGEGGHNVPLIKDKYGIRKLTPEECLGFQGFPEGYSFPNISDSSKYKQVGNSVSVPVIARIASILVDSLTESK